MTGRREIASMKAWTWRARGSPFPLQVRAPMLQRSAALVAVARPADDGEVAGLIERDLATATYN